MTHIRDIVNENGREKILIFSPMKRLHRFMFINYTLSNEPKIPTLCYIKEVTESKIKITPIERSYATEVYHIDDFDGLLQDKQIAILKVLGD